MTTKSIIEIEIADQQFKAHVKEFTAYQERIKKQSTLWSSTGKAIKATASAGKDFFKAISNSKQIVYDLNKYAGNMKYNFLSSKSAADKLRYALNPITKSVVSMAKMSGTFAKNIASAGKGFLSWLPTMGIMSGLLGIGGMFGLKSMAKDVQEGSAQSKRSGTTYGGLKTAGIVYGDIFGGESGVASMLQNINKAQHSGGVEFARLGMKNAEWEGKDAADVLLPMLKAMKAMNAIDPNKVSALAAERFLPEGMDFSLLTQLSKTNLGAREKMFKSNRPSQEISEGTQNAYTTFTQKLELAGASLQKVFIDALVPLTPVISQFMDALVKGFKKLMGTDFMKGLIAGSSKMIEKGVDYFTSGEFSKDLSDMVAALREIAADIKATAEFFKHPGESISSSILKDPKDRGVFAPKDFSGNVSEGKVTKGSSTINLNSTVTWVSPTGEKMFSQAHALSIPR